MNLNMLNGLMWLWQSGKLETSQSRVDEVHDPRRFFALPSSTHLDLQAD